ncbi:hypothetical protein B5181_09405 [Streptomyces sp. 4F]|nr:hypothetical protein B5181_09405 [Streptomyces sp. 4F]
MGRRRARFVEHRIAELGDMPRSGPRTVADEQFAALEVATGEVALVGRPLLRRGTTMHGRRRCGTAGCGMEWSAHEQGRGEALKAWDEL